jgi:hypothetical protein
VVISDVSDVEDSTRRLPAETTTATSLRRPVVRWNRGTAYEAGHHWFERTVMAKRYHQPGLRVAEGGIAGDPLHSTGVARRIASPAAHP